MHDWIRRLKQSPLAWKECPAHLKLESRVRAAYRIGWRDHPELLRCRWAQLSEEDQADPQLRGYLLGAWNKRLRNNPADVRNAPGWVLDESEIQQTLRIQWKKEAFDQLEFDSIPEAFRQMDGVREAWVLGWIQRLAEAPWLLSSIPEGLDWGAISERVMGHWSRQMERRPQFWDSIPAEFQEALEAHRRQCWIGLITGQQPSSWTFGNWPMVPECYRAENGFRQAILFEVHRCLHRDPSLWEILAADFESFESCQAVVASGLTLCLQDERQEVWWERVQNELSPHPAVLEGCRDYALALLLEHPDQWHNVPDYFWADGAFATAAARVLAEALVNLDPDDVLAIMNSPDAIQIMGLEPFHGYTRQLLRIDPEYWDRLPAQCLEDDQLQRDRTEGWHIRLHNDPAHWNAIPSDCRSEDLWKTYLAQQSSFKALSPDGRARAAKRIPIRNIEAMYRRKQRVERFLDEVREDPVLLTGLFGSLLKEPVAEDYLSILFQPLVQSEEGCSAIPGPWVDHAHRAGAFFLWVVDGWVERVRFDPAQLDHVPAVVEEYPRFREAIQGHYHDSDRVSWGQVQHFPPWLQDEAPLRHALQDRVRELIDGNPNRARALRAFWRRCLEAEEGPEE